MQMPQETLFPLVVLALALGMKHGLDADHLATIDGLTRFNLSAGRTRLAKLCGFLFSLGHGFVVCGVALTTSLLFSTSSMPSWLESVGLWVSTFFLIFLGLLNLHAVFTTSADEIVSPLGFKGRMLGKLQHAGHPLLVALVGALFAVSFDTFSNAALLSAASVHLGGAFYALMLAVCFMLGMMMTDVANGLWISHLLRRADRTACTTSRVMCITVAMLSIGVAALGLSRHYVNQIAEWLDSRELVISTVLICIVAGSYLLARLKSRLSPV